MISKLNKDLAKEYNHWHSQVYQTGNLKKIDSRDVAFYNLVLDLLKIKKSRRKSRKKILDVACGKGLFLREARRRNLDVFGIDISKTAIEKAKELIEGEFLIGNAERLPYKDNSFDYVTCLGSLEHFIHPDIGIKEITRVLKRKGKASIYVPNLMFIGHIYMAWRYGTMLTEGEQSFSEVFYTYKGWKNLLEADGLKVIACKKYNHVWATQKANKVIIFLWERLLRLFVPFNLSYCFLFICIKK